MACGPKTADRLSESANVGADVGKQIHRQINLKAADSEYERKWPRIIRSISPVEEYKCAGSGLAIECKGWLPWARVPSAIFRRHYLDRCAPVRELSRSVYVLYTTTVRSPQAACLHRARRVRRSHRTNRRVDAHRNRTSSFPGAQTPSCFVQPVLPSWLSAYPCTR